MKRGHGEVFDLPGGPAFPISIPGAGDNGAHGMSLRDYFAAKAMVAEVITSASDATPQSALTLVEAAHKAGRTIEAHIAFNAYKLADAMLAERTK